ncbi:MAG TPA: carboxymuconolactone decarboxylase family protein [Burkholderiaceae bacterium]|nr:carboxymuconolactone decarboxylase family protein [Burkholderiaceae bacterium]
MTHAARIDYQTHAPKALKALFNLSQTANGSAALGKRLIDLVQLRVSQINGCAFCIDMHWADLLKQDVNPRHVNAVAGWREAPFFSERERAALNWAEAVTAIPQRDPSDADFAQLKAHFSDAEIAELGFVIGTITFWNLLNVSFRTPLPETPYSV